MGLAVVERRVAAVEVEVGIEVVGDFQAGFFQGGKRAATGQQFGFKRAPASFGLRVVVRIARPAEAGQGLGLFDAGPAGGAGVLAAAVRVDNQAGCGLAQRQGLFQGREYK